jgi:hypothetical protein
LAFAKSFFIAAVLLGCLQADDKRVRRVHSLKERWSVSYRNDLTAEEYSDVLLIDSQILLLDTHNSNIKAISVVNGKDL